VDSEKCGALLWILETGSLTAAADKLGYTPSGISRMMAALETETGFPLLRRSHSGVAATPECELLLPTVRELAHWGERYTELAAEIRGVQCGRITVGTAYAAYYGWLTQLVSAFVEQYPQIGVQLIEGTSSELCRAVEEKRADFCIISRREGEHDWLPLSDDPLVALVPRTHPLAGEKVFPLSDFAADDYIDVYPSRETDNSRVFAREGIRPNIRYSTADSAAAASMVEAGLGVTLLNTLVARKLQGQFVKLPVTPPQLISIGIAVPTREVISPAARRFAELARQRLDSAQPENSAL